MTDTNRSIAKSVALKAAVDVAKDKFDVDGDISAQAEKIIVISDKFYDYLLTGTINAAHEVFETEEKAVSETNDVVHMGGKGKFEPQCPECNSKVYDNRQTAKDKQPLWKCSNKGGCDTGKGWPWSSWNADEFNNAELAFNAGAKPQAKDNFADNEAPF